MQIIRNLNQIVTLKQAFKKEGRRLNPQDLGIIDKASIVMDNEKVIWIGKDSDFPEKYKGAPSKNGEGFILTPGIADSHTHLVFGGDRAFEYTMRLNGADYEDIGKSGGGILSTMKATLESSTEKLYNDAKKRIETIYSYGVRAIEIKSGYALTFDKEKEITLIINRLKENFSQRIIIHNTFMAAHAIPSNFKSSSEYINDIVIPLLDDHDVSNAIDSVDIFHESGYFSQEDVEVLFKYCQKKSLNVRIHADEFNDNKGAILASKYQALSADHLLCTNEDGILALANSNTVATVLPGTAFFLGKKLANARGMLDAGCRVAIASDYNPGSSHCDNLILIASIAAKSMSFNIAELWAAITLNAYKSLNIKNAGYLSINSRAIVTLFEAKSIDEITYKWGHNLSRDLSNLPPFD